MLPGYTPDFLVAQNHIHLGAVPYDGSAPTGFGEHGEPPYRFTVQFRIPHPEFIASFQRTLTGAPVVYTLRSTDNVRPLVWKGMNYRLKVDHEGYRILEGLINWTVYWVDSLHCNDDEDHTPYVKKMFFENLAYEEHYDPTLTMNVVNITLRDMYTVAKP